MIYGSDERWPKKNKRSEWLCKKDWCKKILCFFRVEGYKIYKECLFELYVHMFMYIHVYVGLQYKTHVFVSMFWRSFIFLDTSSSAFFWTLLFSTFKYPCKSFKQWHFLLLSEIINSLQDFFKTPSSYGGLPPFSICNRGGKLSRFSLEAPNLYTPWH